MKREFPFTIRINDKLTWGHSYVRVGDKLTALKSNILGNLYRVVHPTINDGNAFYIPKSCCSLYGSATNRNGANSNN